MKLREQSITNISSFLTIIISLIIAVSIPVTYFIVVYQYMDGTINAEIAFSARAVEEIVTKNPKSWQFEKIRLQEILGRCLDNNYRDNRRIRDLQGRIVAQTKEPLAHPVVTFSQPVYDSGTTEVARIEIERSIVPLVTNTVLLGVCSALSGVLIFLFFHFLPLRTMREAYDKLQKSESFFKEITDNASDVIFITDRNGDIKYCSRSVERFLGYKPEELIGRSAFMLIHPDDRERAFNDYSEALLSKNKAIPNAFRVLHKDGSERYFEGLGENLLDNPLVSGFIMNVYDGTARKRMEEELKENASRYKHLFDNAAVGIYKIDFKTGKFSDANNAFLEYAGYSQEELNALSPYDVLTEDSKKRFAERLEKMFRGEKVPETVEYDVVDRKGKQRCIHLSTKNIYDAQGNVIASEVVAQDITQRKLEANALRESERQYKLITEKMTDIVWIADMDLKVIYVTPSVHKVLGFTPEETKNQTLKEKLTPNSLANGMEKLARELAIEKKGDGDPNRTVNLVLEYYHRDGSTRWLETIISGIRNDQGVLTGLHGVSRDITKRKLAEEKFYKIFMTTPDCIAITRLKDGLIKDVNQGFEDIVGWKREVAIGTKTTEPPLDFWVDLSERDFLTAELGMGRDILHRQIEFKRSDNSVRTGIYSARPINVDGEESLIFILQDITEQKRMEKELAESNKTKLMNQIASGVAHEVRNPLHAIQAISEAMAIDMDEKSDHRDYLVHIKTQVGRLSHLMNDLLDLGKPIQSSLFGQALLTEIATAALGYWMEAHPQQSQRVKIVNNLQHDALVLADSNKIQQVIINLMENAAQNSPKDETILLGLSKASERYLMVEVIDRGVGLKSQDQFKVFEPFYTTRKGGTGLGLSLCKHIIENHGGTIEIFNNKDVPGCTARFTIPAYNSKEHK
ncbi:MAG: PAS domain S-box protein [Smithella sp.]